MSEDRLRELPLYISPRRLGRVACALFVLTAAVSWIAAGYRFAEVEWIVGIQEGRRFEVVERIAHDVAGEILAGAQVATGVILAAVFLPWLYRTRVNLRALGLRRLRYGREWTLLGFFIPVLNLTRPYQVVREIWRGSDPSSGDAMAWQRAPVSSIVPLWWGAFLGFIAIELVSALLLSLAIGLPRIRLAHSLGLAADACAALSASFGYFVVARISRAQDLKHSLYGAGEPAPAQPFDPRDGAA